METADSDHSPEPITICRKVAATKTLPDDIVQQLVLRYQSGRSVRQLTVEFEVHRQTVLEHLKRAGASRRPHVRKLTDELVQEAGRLYATGLSLKSVASQFSVNETTIRNEFTRASIQVRPRRGWSRAKSES